MNCGAPCATILPLNHANSSASGWVSRSVSRTGAGPFGGEAQGQLPTHTDTGILHASIRHGGKLQVLADDYQLLTDSKLDVLEPGLRRVIGRGHDGEVLP